jgi:hypothetical protein
LTEVPTTCKTVLFYRPNIDDKHFRNIVIWLEDQKVRRYKIEERESLRNSTETEWGVMLKQYLVCHFLSVKIKYIYHYQIQLILLSCAG